MSKLEQAFYDFINSNPLDKIPTEKLNNQYIRYWVSTAIATEIHEKYSYDAVLYNSNKVMDYRMYENVYDFKFNDTVIYPTEDVYKGIIKDLELDAWQIYIYNHNDIVTFGVEKELPETTSFVFIAPDLDNNVKILNSIMNDYGYYNALEAIQHHNGKDWKYIMFNPKKKFNCNEWLKESFVLFHITDANNVTSIEFNGLKVNMNKKENRVYFYRGVWKLDKNFVRMIKTIAIQRHITQLAAIPIFITDELLNEIKFYLDPNASGCVFCNCDVSPKFIDYKKIEFVSITELNNLIK